MQLEQRVQDARRYFGIVPGVTDHERDLCAVCFSLLSWVLQDETLPSVKTFDENLNEFLTELKKLESEPQPETPTPESPKDS